jgi:hypothetical protein
MSLYILGYSYGVVRKQCHDCIKNFPGEQLSSESVYGIKFTFFLFHSVPPPPELPNQILDPLFDWNDGL